MRNPAVVAQMITYGEDTLLTEELSAAHKQHNVNLMTKWPKTDQL